MADSCVKVGVRIRPLLPQEQHQNNCLGHTGTTASSIHFRNQQFTFDHVFGIGISQQGLYEQTAAPMLKSFLDGYNVTIMAYGQTGSGKSYTMGTSESTLESGGSEGLIPRFVYDLFENLPGLDEEAPAKEIGSSPVTVVTVQFMEIYGEDVFDLLPVGHSAADRQPLSVRENEAGQVVVQGLQQQRVESAEGAVGLLYAGMKNRITSATLMNASSSRSHAVYVITLEQSTGGDQDAQKMTSRLTFVDLAGSERIARTQAEGKLKKEGIQINSGLFCLGQVINGLADDQRLKAGKQQTHIPYRNSKLTHLLKDALGGNSQTLFLACVSPAESNESESYSTLTYAKAARNIRNKPVRNMDKTQVELMRLRYAVKAWTLKAVSHLVEPTTSAAAAQGSGSGSTSRMSLPLPDLSPQRKTIDPYVQEVLGRPDVQEYIRAVNRAIDAKLDSDTAGTPRRVRLSMGVAGTVSSSSSSPSRNCPPVRNLIGQFEKKSAPARHVATVSKRDSSAVGVALPRTFDNVAPVDLPDVEESERLVARMQAMVAQEKELGEVQEEGAEELLAVDRVIEEKERILGRLMETVKGFSVIKNEYEKLVEQIGSLESERLALESELRSKAAASESSVGSKGFSAQMEMTKARYEKVKQELEGVREEKRRKENAYKLMQKESRSCDTLEREISKLKESKVALMRQQKATAQQVERMRREQQTMQAQSKRQDVEKSKQVHSLRGELDKKQRVLGAKDKEIGRVCSKLRACEEHISQLLKMNRSRVKQAKLGLPSDSSLSGADMDHLASTKKLLDSMLNDRVLLTCARAVFDRKASVLAELNAELQEEAQEMEACVLRLTETDDEDDAEHLRRTVRASEANIDRITRELDLHNADLEEASLRIEALGRNSATESFEKVGRDVVTSLRLEMLQALSLDLIHEKVDTMEALRKTEEELDEARDKVAGLEERTRSLELAARSAGRDFRQQLEQAEKQRHDDLWSVVRAQDCSTIDDRLLSSMVDSVGQTIAIQRALDLERELETLMENSSKAKEENSVLVARVQELESQLQLAKSSGAQKFPPAGLDALASLWRELGASADQREAALTSIRTAGDVASRGVLKAAQEQLQESLKIRDETLRTIKAVCVAFELDSSGFEAKARSIRPLCEVNNDLAAIVASLKDATAIKVERLFDVKDRLLRLLADMSLGDADVSSSLQEALKIGKAGGDLAQVAEQLNSASIIVSEPLLSAWTEELSRLNVKRAGTTARMVSARDKVVALIRELGLDQSAVREVSIGGDVGKEALEVAVTAVTTNAGCNPPGNESALRAMEQLELGLQSMRIHRECVGKSLAAVLHFLSSYCEGELAEPEAALYYHKSEIIRLFDLTADTVVTLCESEGLIVSKMHGFAADIASMATSLSGGAVDTEDMIEAAKKFSSDELFMPMAQAVDDMSGIAELLDETWLRLSIADFSKLWQTKRHDLVKIIGIKRECRDVSALASAVRQLQKLDLELAEQVQSMETFEASSQQDRQKILSGSSKQLVDEEKFRKQSKKKFAGLSDQILNCVFAVRQLSSERCKIDFSGLSPQTRGLVNGGAVQEKTELMHLHTSTHGTKRWSGDREVLQPETTANPLEDSHRTPPPPSLGRLYSKSTAKDGGSAPDTASKRSVSPLKPRAGSPSRGANATPLWLPHTKPVKPALKSAVKRTNSDEENEVGNVADADAVFNPLAKPQKPAHPKIIKNVF